MKNIFYFLIILMVILSGCATVGSSGTPDKSSNEMSNIYVQPLNLMTEIERNSVRVTDFSNDFNPLIRIAPIVWQMIEISIYDEELDTTFTVVVTKPPSFAESNDYPCVITIIDVMDDYDVIGLCQGMMTDNKIEDFILVTILHESIIDISEQFIKFVNENLLPYIGEELYNINFGNSQFYGDNPQALLEKLLLDDYGIGN